MFLKFCAALAAADVLAVGFIAAITLPVLPHKDVPKETNPISAKYDMAMKSCFVGGFRSSTNIIWTQFLPAEKRAAALKKVLEATNNMRGACYVSDAEMQALLQ